VYAKSDVIGLTINHKDMTRDQVLQCIKDYEAKYGLPACDMLVDGPKKIADAIIQRFFPDRA
jgi:uncharacterized NAD-dependent epimerase/dehydratase family protein